jgi:nucleoside-triphosphatase THEP1
MSPPELHHPVFVATGPLHGGKTTFVSGLIERLRDEGIPVGGFICEGTFRENKRSSFTLVDLENGEKTELASAEHDRWPIRLGRYCFNPEAFAKGEQIIRKAVAGGAEVVIIDEIGPLELNGEGWSHILESLEGSGAPVQVWVVRQQILEQVLERWQIPYSNVFPAVPGKQEAMFNKIMDHVRNHDLR